MYKTIPVKVKTVTVATDLTRIANAVGTSRRLRGVANINCGEQLVSCRMRGFWTNIAPSESILYSDVNGLFHGSPGVYGRTREH